MRAAVAPDLQTIDALPLSVRADVSTVNAEARTAEVVFSSLETGEVFRFGHVAPDVLKRSFGI